MREPIFSTSRSVRSSENSDWFEIVWMHLSVRYFFEFIVSNINGTQSSLTIKWIIQKKKNWPFSTLRFVVSFMIVLKITWQSRHLLKIPQQVLCINSKIAQNWLTHKGKYQYNCCRSRSCGICDNNAVWCWNWVNLFAGLN